MSFTTISPGAWELTTDQQYELFTLLVPISWQQVAKFLAKKRFQLTGKGYYSVPVYSLDPIIAASFPNIIKTERNGWQSPHAPWLLATEKAEMFGLPALIKDWLLEEFSHSIGNDEVESILDNLDDDDWKWEDKSTMYPLRLPAKKQSGIDVRFQAIPDFLAVEFLKNPQVAFGMDNQYKLTFYRVVRLAQGAEMMSWPPTQIPLIKYKQQLGTAHISFVIRFTLQTVPWRNEPIIYHQLSIRRWIIEPLEKLPYGGVTAFIGDNRRWLDGKKQPFRLISLKTIQTMTPEGRKSRWSKAISELLKINDSPLPDPNILAGSPAYNWSVIGEDPQGIQVAIAYDNRHYGNSPCLPGVSPLDLASLDSATRKLDQDAYFWEKVKSPEKDSEEVKTRDHSSTPMLRPKIAAPATFSAVNQPPNTILILWETQQCRDKLIEEICTVLLLTPKGETKKYEIMDGITGEATFYEGSLGYLCIKTQHVADLTQNFDFDNFTEKGRLKRINCMDQRIAQIITSLPKSEGLSGALIEIRPKPPNSQIDPKLALRIGAMQAGYINQHIHALTKTTKEKSESVTKDAANRVQRAVSDLLRQFGVLPAPLIDPKKDGINQNIWLTCFYVLRRTRKTSASNTPSTVALMVRVNSVTGLVQMTTPSLFSKEEWLSYPKGLFYLLSEKWDPNSDESETPTDISDQKQSEDTKKEQNLINEFVAKCLKNCLNTRIEGEIPQVLFMAEAENARRILTWLKNPELPVNDLPDVLKRHMMTESEINRLWVVRLRLAGNMGEVPVAIVKDFPGSRTSGLFCWQNVCDDPKTALYLSMRKQLITEQGTSTLQIKDSRLDNGSSQPGNPKPLEIAIVHHPGIERDKLARLIHNLRDRWPYFANEVSLPLPFPPAILAKEYAVSAKDLPESEDFEEAESE
jgi:pPIWI_RE module N-terminal domain/RNaseH domain of pPIWI_RE/MID domain of pPIWI_RE